MPFWSVIKDRSRVTCREKGRERASLHANASFLRMMALGGFFFDFLAGAIGGIEGFGQFLSPLSVASQ